MANDGPAERSRHAIKSMIPIDSSIRYKFGIKEQDVDDKELGALGLVGTLHSESEVI